MASVKSHGKKTKGELHRIVIEKGANGVSIKGHRKMPKGHGGGMSAMMMDNDADDQPTFSTKRAHSMKHLAPMLDEMHGSETAAPPDQASLSGQQPEPVEEE